MDTRIVWHPAGVTSLDPATGRIWWEHDFRDRTDRGACAGGAQAPREDAG